MWRTIRGVLGLNGGDRDAQRRRRSSLDGGTGDYFDVHMLPTTARPPPSADSMSVASNPSVSSYDSSTRQHQHKYIARQYFGPNSQTDYAEEYDEATSHSNNDRSAAGASAGSLFDSNGDDGGVEPMVTMQLRREETLSQREERKENQRAFESLVHLANTNQPVTLDAFKRRVPHRDESEEHKDAGEEDDEDFTPMTRDRRLRTQLNTELIEAYIAYARSIGREPDIEVTLADPLSGDEEEVMTAEHRSLVQERRILADREHWGTQWIGTRYSKRRGCVQFWSFFLVGVVVTIVMIVFLATVHLNEVLHLDAFVGHDVVLVDDFAYLHLRDEVGFRLKYEIDASQQPDAGQNATFQVLLLSEDDFERYEEGEEFSYVANGSRLATTYASLPLTRFEDDDEEMYLVIQPCRLPRHRNDSTSLDYCQTNKLPTPIKSKQKLYSLKTQTSDRRSGFVIHNFYANPMPDDCSESGWKGASFMLIFVPYLVASLFGLRVFQMAFHCESFRANLERNYCNEFAVPEAEVDYWQPNPWDRKVPKTRLLGPCCWRKMRRPIEPFYTWWRHENYFTWIFFPYRNERLSRGERSIIIFCSLYITFYVTFVLAMVHGLVGVDLPVIGSIVIYYIALMVLPSLVKAIFKEIFKLIFRQRRKYFRAKAAGGDTSGFSFRFAFMLQVLVVVFISLAQGPLLYIWLYRSCKFLGDFLYFGLLAAFTRLSLLGLMQDFLWYSVISTWGWRDLCPHCTERLVHCDCFNDELLVMAVERVGAKWELILILDKVLSRHAGHEPQFHGHYTAQQLHERWLVLVARAEAHLEKVEKLQAYKLKKKRDALRRRTRMTRVTRLAERASFTTRGGRRSTVMQHEDQDRPVDDSEDEGVVEVDSTRERKILALNRKIDLGKFEKHYDSSIVDVFHVLQRAVRGAVSHETTPAQRLAKQEDEQERRRRAFRVLGEYRIEKRTDANEEAQSKPLKRTMAGRWGSLGSVLGATRELLLPTRAPLASTAEDDDIVVVVTDVESLGLTPATSVEDEDEEAEALEPPVPQEHTYEVTEREQTLWRRTASQVGALAGWVFKYDSTQY